MYEGATLHPGLYHQGLLRAARRHGARVVGHSAATAVTRDGNRFRVSCYGKDVVAGNVLCAGNAYSLGAAAWASSYMLRLRSYVVATEELGDDVMAKLIPNQRSFYDTRRISYYFRPSPDGRRLIFGSRPMPWEISHSQAAILMRKQIVELFPSLKGVSLSHCWSGYVGYSAGKLPIVGRMDDGLHYCMGYCGQGVATATWLSTEYIRSVLGLDANLGIFEATRPRTQPPPLRSSLSAGLAIAWFQTLDRLGA